MTDRTTETVQADCGDVIAALLPGLAAAQTAHRASTGRYWQSGCTHSRTPPAHTTSTDGSAVPTLTDVPTDQTLNLRQFLQHHGQLSPPLVGLLARAWPCSLQVHVWGAPGSAQGWRLEATFRHNGQRRCRTLKRGDADGRAAQVGDDNRWTTIEP